MKVPYELKKLNDDFTINTEDYYEENGGVIFPNPNAPTSIGMGLDKVRDILDHNQDVIVVIDETYVDFGGETALPLLDEYKNLVITRTFSKSRSLAGMRLGFAMASEELVSYMNAVKDSYNTYPLDTVHTYFDCTNFYFEIDKEDDFRLKGPSKENRRESIIGMGLLLDANQIPIGMKMYPGNDSEKPIIRNIIDDLKKRSHISGRTIQIADKGLNCFNNIAHALKAGDGYIFSKSVKTLPETEKTWVLLENDYADVKNKRGEILYRIKECVDDFSYSYTDTAGHKKTVKLTEKRIVTFNPKLAAKQKYEINRQVEKAKKLKASQAKRSEYGDSSKYVSFIPTNKKGEETEGAVKVEINEKSIENARKFAGYNMIVTSEIHMAASKVYAAYHNLWRIEESFRVMKSQLDARPVYLQKQETITGHFLICYLAVLLTRILQRHILKNQYGTEEIFDFIRDFRVAKISDRKYINLSRNSSFIKFFSDHTGLPLTSYFMGNTDIKKVLSHRF